MITIFFAPPGAGKSTFCARFAWWNWFLKKFKLNTYERVLCNFPVKHTYLFEKDDIGVFDLSDGKKTTLVLLDEVSVEFHARMYKSLQAYQIEHFKKHRKYHEDFIIFSQVFDDMDKVLRDLAPRLYYIKKSLFFPFTVKALRLRKSIMVDKDKHQVIDGYEFDPWYLRWLTTKRCYLPFYWGMFDSWDAPDLPTKTFKYYE